MGHEAVYKTTESSLPLLDLVALLQEQQKTGSIHTVLSSLFFSKRVFNGLYLAQVVLEQGKLLACSIVERDTGMSMLKAQTAFRYLCGLEDITWKVTLGEIPSELSPSRAVQEAPHSQPFTKRIPQRLGEPTPPELSNLSRKHRQVLSLVDGQRTIEEIGRLLSLKTGDVEYILHELASITLIILN